MSLGVASYFRGSPMTLVLLIALVNHSLCNNVDFGNAFNNDPTFGRANPASQADTQNNVVKNGANISPEAQHDGIDKDFLKQRVLDMYESYVLSWFYHGYNNYMKFAFPKDELNPLSSTSRNFAVSDTMKLKEHDGLALTLIESLSTLAVIGNASEFEKGVNWLAENLEFEIDLVVSLFETTIRLLGGLLSAHCLASHATLGPKLMRGGYNGQLLDLAHSLGLRLLPAFSASPTGIPYGWVNLKYGVDNYTDTIFESNTAAAGSLILEMGMLSHLTGNPIFESGALKALGSLWKLRSPVNLFGSSMDIRTGLYMNPIATIGANADSFYEYLLKAYILFGKEDYWIAFQRAYESVCMYLRQENHWYAEVNYRIGTVSRNEFQSCEAFWPGLQVLAGDVKLASLTFDSYMQLWCKYDALPEVYSYSYRKVHSTLFQYPLRPELIESNYHLYKATGNEKYLKNGKKFIDSLYKVAWVKGGWANVKSVLNHDLDDHMPSYFLAETCKYLYLLFDDSIFKEANFVFTTEGHLFPNDLDSLNINLYDGLGAATKKVFANHPYFKEVKNLAFANVTKDEIAIALQATFSRKQCSLSQNKSFDVLNDQGGLLSDLMAVLEKEEMAKLSKPNTNSKDLANSFKLKLQSSKGWYKKQHNALDKKICPRFTPWLQCTSLCHIPNRFLSGKCTFSHDCGVEAESCRKLVCHNGFCQKSGLIVIK